MTRQDLQQPIVTKRLLQLKAQGKSFSEIWNLLNKEFSLNIPNRQTITNFYYNNLAGLTTKRSLTAISKGTDDAEKFRTEQTNIIMEQMEKINAILWSYYHELEKSKKILKSAVRKWKLQLDSEDSPNIDIVREIRATMSSNISNITMIATNILKQLELQSKAIGMITRPTTVNVSNLDITLQMNQTLNRIEKLGYVFVKPQKDFEVEFDGLVKSGKLKSY